MGDLNDKLMLSDIYPSDYKDSFGGKNPSLRTFMFNLPAYHLDNASFKISEHIIHCVETIPNNDPKLKIECQKKSARFTYAPSETKTMFAQAEGANVPEMIVRMRDDGDGNANVPEVEV